MEKKRLTAILFSFLCDLLVSHNLGAEKTVMDLSTTLYLLRNFSEELKYSQEFMKASEKIITLLSIKRSKRASSGMYTEQLINFSAPPFFLLFLLQQ